MQMIVAIGLKLTEVIESVRSANAVAQCAMQFAVR